MYHKSNIIKQKHSFPKEKHETDRMEFHLKLRTQWNRENRALFFYSEFIENVLKTTVISIKNEFWIVGILRPGTN